jgi:capsular polysaccharide biosynthesis protein
MEKTEQTARDYYTIDIFHMLKYIWKKVWIVVIVGLLTAAVGFSASAFFMTPKYSASVMLYINNKTLSIDGIGSITQGDITASQSLLKTYTVILKTRTTLEAVIDKSDLGYSYQELEKMVDASSANGTEIMKVTVTSEDPYEAARIANSIAEVFPVRISEIIEGSSIEVVDSAIPILQKVSPSITKYTAVGLLIGVLASVSVLVVFALLDDVIHDEEYVLTTYNYPILAKIPDLNSSGSDKKYGYYYSK